MAANSIQEGVSTMLQLTGVGKLRPNTLVMGYKCDWNVIADDQLKEYFEIIHNALDLNYGICIFRLRAGFDVRGRGGKANHYSAVSSRPQQQMPRNQAELETTYTSNVETVDSYSMAIESGRVGDQTEEGEGSGTSNSSTEELITMPSRFEERQNAGFIDVWWLYDDGGT